MDHAQITQTLPLVAVRQIVTGMKVAVVRIATMIVVEEIHRNGVEITRVLEVKHHLLAQLIVDQVLLVVHPH